MAKNGSENIVGTIKGIVSRKFDRLFFGIVG
jgi:hypothetical protein